MQLNEDQEKAIEYAVNNKFSIITGPAGTGKTTIIKEIANKVAPYNLISFTGKAAARLREASGLPTSTIHSMLGYNGDDFMCDTLRGQSIIIDEASMTDAWLIAEIIKRNPERIVLVGDNAQLPPVGQGQPFHDLINLRPDIVNELSICYRNSEAVYKAGNTIRKGQIPLKTDKSENESWNVINTGDGLVTQNIILDWIGRGKIDFEQDIILCCRNGDQDEPGTAKGMNHAIIKKFSPREPGRKWKVDDRIICLRNFADADVWNGTTGTITAIEKDGVWVKGDIPFYSHEEGEYLDEIKWKNEILFECQHAYALTVHKSQGSQYRNVIFCAFNRDLHMLLSRSLIYTAVTRTKTNCIVAGDFRAFCAGIQKEKNKETVLQEKALETKKLNNQEKQEGVR